MTAKLRIRVDAASGTVAKAGTVARVVPLSNEDEETQEIVLPAGVSEPGRDVSKPCTDVRVAGGSYMVEAVLPWGALLKAQVSVGEGEEKEVVLQGKLAPGRPVAWHLLRIVNEATQAAAVQANQALDALRSKVPGLAAPDAAAARVTTYEVASMPLGCWNRLSKLARARRAVSLGELADALDAREVGRHEPKYGDKRTALFEWTDAPPNAVRTIAIVERDGVIEVVPVPVPWQSDGTRVPFELAVPADPALPLEALIRDPEFGTMISYLGTGLLVAAREILSPGLQQLSTAMLMRKVENPYAAAAAACALVQAESTQKPQEWDAWIGNLDAWFPWLPDGAALHGVRRLRTAHELSDARAACDCFVESLKRGVPVFAPVTRLMVDALTVLVGDPEFDSSPVNDTFAAVRDTMLRMQVQHSFTILRFEHQAGEKR